MKKSPFIAGCVALLAAGCTTAPPAAPPVGGEPSGASAASDGQLPGSVSGGAGSGPTLERLPYAIEQRPPNPTCLAGDAPSTGYKLERIWQGISFTQPLGLVPAPGRDELYVVEKTGRLRAVPADPKAATTREVLNISDLISTDAESGLLSVAFHPSYAVTGHAYVTYTRNDGKHSTRISRFTSLDGGQTLARSTEVELLEIPQLRGTHHGGHLAFGPDGMLYASIGDDNTGDDYTNWIAADAMSWLGKVLRLDIRVPGAGYSIPADNPFAQGGGAPEVWATGLRNPWRFSFDRSTGKLWLGDVGEADWEEFNIIERGRFYGWPFWEGTHCLHDCDNAQDAPPVFEFMHNGLTAICGGYVYRGSAIPELVGRYIYGDYGSGEIWSYDPDSRENQSLNAGGGQLSGWGEDNQGELYATRMNGTIERLVAAGAVGGGFPELLSQTGCFESADRTQPVPGAIPYSIAVPFWSDGADKERFVALPDGAALEVAADGDLSLPVGGVTIKNFRFEGKLFETRFFVRHNDGSSMGYSYEWNADQSDATLVASAGKPALVPGLAWSFPSRSNCFSCHSDAAGKTLGLELQQLSIDLPLGENRVAGQVETFLHLGLLPAGALPMNPLAAATDLTASLEQRALSYLHVNCSSCHRPNGPGRGPFDARFEVPLAAKGMCNVEPEHGDLGVPGARLIAPGSHQASVLWLRMSQRERDFMPPIASQKPDAGGAGLLAEWIDTLAVCP